MNILIFGILPTFDHIKTKPLNISFNFKIMKIYLARIGQIIFNSLLPWYVRKPPLWSMQRNRGKQQNGKDERSLQEN